LPEIGVVIEQHKELAAVFVREKDLLSIIAALGDVQRVVRGREA